MIIGIPRERKSGETRVAVTPDGCIELVREGHTVLVEVSAGVMSGFKDADYIASGATMVPALAEVWNAELVVKVKEPDASEFPLMKRGQLLFDYLHLASSREVTKACIESGVTGIAYELITLADGRLPLLEPMSEVAGRLSVTTAAQLLLSQHGGKGLLIGGTTTTRPAHVVIIGAGVSGRQACDVALGLGATVSIFDRNPQRLVEISKEFGHRATTLAPSHSVLLEELRTADVIIGAVLVPGAAAPKIITREMLSVVKPLSVFIDISIDQGGCAETSRPTTLASPTYTEMEVIHYGVCNIPAQVPQTSTKALSVATLPYIKRIAKEGIAVVDIRKAVCTHEGRLTNAAVGDAHGIVSSAI